MARTPATPRKSSLTSSTDIQTERAAKRIARQQKQLEKTLVNEMTAKVTTNAGKMVKYSDLVKLNPLTDTQQDFFEAWNNAPEDNIGFVLSGSAGTGKTFVSLHFALQEILMPEPQYKKIVIIRSAVQTRDMGFLKGSDIEKSAIYEIPYINICSDLTKNKNAYEKLKEVGKIEFMSTSFMRGLTLNDTIVIIDESQSCNWHELNTICSRVGHNSKLIVIGDMIQNDLIKNRNDVSGFKEFLQVSRKMSEFRTFTFTSDDIVRSNFCKSWIIACESIGL